MTLTARIDELIQKHGSLRAAARVLRIDDAYLFRLHSGEKHNPTEKILRKLGLRRSVSYKEIKPQCECTYGDTLPECQIHGTFRSQP